MFWEHLFGRPDGKPVYFYTQKATCIAEGSVILVQKTKKSIAITCEVKTVSKTEGKDPKYLYVCLDIFTGEKHTHQVQVKRGECRCPFVYDAEYEITGISEDGQLSLITKDDKKRAPLSLPAVLPPAHKKNPPKDPKDPRCDDDCHVAFLPRYRARLAKGKLLYALVKSAMGTERVTGITQWKYQPPPPSETSRWHND